MGDADLYVNVGTNTFATRSNSQYRSLSATGVDRVVVSSTDRYYPGSLCDPARHAASCIVNIGVYGFSASSAFYILQASTTSSM